LSTLSYAILKTIAHNTVCDQTDEHGTSVHEKLCFVENFSNLNVSLTTKSPVFF